MLKRAVLQADHKEAKRMKRVYGKQQERRHVFGQSFMCQIISRDRHFCGQLKHRKML